MSERASRGLTGRHPQRIAFVSDAVYPFNEGGKERRVWEISRRLARKGHEVHIYTMRWRRETNTIEADGVWMHAIRRRWPLYKEGRHSTTQAMAVGDATLRLATQEFDARDVDHISCFPLLSARLVCSLRHKRLTATWHEAWGHQYWADYIGRSSPLASMVERLSARMPHRIISVSLQTTGRLGLRCLLVGEGPERLPLQRLADDLGMSEDVRFVDFLSGEALYGAMRSSRVFVLLSVPEGFGLVVLKANMCGLPVVTISHPDNAARHLVLEGRKGFVAKHKASDIARTITSAMDTRRHLDPRAAVVEAGLASDGDEVVNQEEGVLVDGASALPRSSRRPTCAWLSRR